MIKNIDLDQNTIDLLKGKADASKRMLKPYMELVLTKHSAQDDVKLWDFLCKTLKKAGVNDKNYTARLIFDEIKVM